MQGPPIRRSPDAVTAGTRRPADRGSARCRALRLWPRLARPELSEIFSDAAALAHRPLQSARHRRLCACAMAERADLRRDRKEILAALRRKLAAVEAALPGQK